MEADPLRIFAVVSWVGALGANLPLWDGGVKWSEKTLARYTLASIFFGWAALPIVMAILGFLMVRGIFRLTKTAELVPALPRRLRARPAEPEAGQLSTPADEPGRLSKVRRRDG